MEVLYGEDVASHIGLESCVGICTDADEALIGAYATCRLEQHLNHRGSE